MISQSVSTAMARSSRWLGLSHRDSGLIIAQNINPCSTWVKL